MGLFLNQQDKRSELQEKIAADLREKAMRTSKTEDGEWDVAKDSAYLDGTKQTTSLGWAWMIIAVVALGILITFMVQGM